MTKRDPYLDGIMNRDRLEATLAEHTPWRALECAHDWAAAPVVSSTGEGICDVFGEPDVAEPRAALIAAAPETAAERDRLLLALQEFRHNPCQRCHGLGEIEEIDTSAPNGRNIGDCSQCGGLGWLPSTVEAERDRLRAINAELLTALAGYHAGAEAAMSSSYCEWCDTHAECNEDGVPVDDVRHDQQCPYRLARAAIALAKEIGHG